MSRITAAQRRAAAHLTTTSTTAPAPAAYGFCEDCGKPLEAHEFNRCTACVIKRGDGVLAANSVTFFEQDEIPFDGYIPLYDEEPISQVADSRDAAF